MNTDILEGKWKQLKGQAQQKWGSITDDEWDKVAGRKEEFIGLLQEKEGKGREEAEREFEAFAKSQQ
ncbi:UNVERIFIED_CONTAM: hypothetical protein GTU68_009815 [Idotea baltica]|nr:hypothetical protein [Idotea baltica]